MKKPDLEKMPTADLLREFAESNVQQSIAEQRSDYKLLNKLYRVEVIVAEELERRGERAALRRLYDHPNLRARVHAAKRTFALFPEEAQNVLETVAATGRMPDAADAGISLVMRDQGLIT